MFKKLILSAVAAAIAFAPGMASASQGLALSAAPVKVSVQIQALCKSVQVGNFNFGPVVPNDTSSNGGTVLYAASTLSNDCVSGTSYSVATFDSCNLSNGDFLIAYDIFVNNGGSVNNCSAPTAGAPTHVATFQAGGSGTNNVQLVASIHGVGTNLPAGTYSDNVTAVIYF